MKCADCRWFNKENEFCMKDGGSVFGATIDDECEYADNMTVFDRITVSPEVLAEKLVYKKGQKMIRESKDYDGWNVSKISTQDIWKSTITQESYKTKPEAIAATVARLKEKTQ